jgi:pimeloyl-[acyl-carrier protein] methyl ester esterase
MDGTGELFRPLTQVIPARLTTRVVSYPTDQCLSYAALLDLLGAQLRSEREVVLVAESFSGPLALRYAAANAGVVRAVVLCASFVRPPLPRWLRCFVIPALFLAPPPAWALRRWMVGPGAPASLVRAVRESVRKVRARVLAHRLREVFDVECSDALRACPAPVLYLAAARDALVRRRSVQAIRAAGRQVTIRQLDGPHFLLQTEPAAAWQEIIHFLRTTDSGGGWECMSRGVALDH